MYYRRIIDFNNAGKNSSSLLNDSFFVSVRQQKRRPTLVGLFLLPSVPDGDELSE